MEIMGKVTISLTQQVNNTRELASQLKIERILRGNSTKSRVLLEEAGKAAHWRDVTPSELHTLLLPYGINTSHIDRYVVTQSRQSIEVQDPAKLLAYLECLLGTAHLANEIRKEEGIVQEIKRSITQDEDECDRLQELRKTLSPEVAKWNAFLELKAEVDQTNQQLLVRRDKLLQAKLELNTALVAKLQQEQGSLQSCRAASAAALQETQEELRTLVKKRNSLSAKVKSARQKATAGQAEAARALGEVKQAQEALEASVRMKELVAKRSKAMRLKIASAEAAAAAAEAAHSNLLAKVQMKQQAVHGQPEPSEKLLHAEAEQEEDASAPSLSEREAVLKEAQQRQSRLQREMQLVAAKLAAAEQAREKATSLLLEAERSSSEHSDAAAEAAAKVAATDRKVQEVQAQLQSHTQKKLLLQEAEDSLQALDGPGGEQEQEGAAEPHGKGRWSAYDAAVYRLHAAAMEQSASLSAPAARRFFGRLCNVLRVTEPSAAAAVNAMLPEVCAPATTLVTADRAAAYEAVAAFAAVGRVTCRVLAELPAAGRTAPDAEPQVMLPGGVNGVRLASVVRGDPEAVPGVQLLVQHLFGGWAMVGDRAAALQVMAAQQRGGGGAARWSLVTPAGELFKADGEIAVLLRSRQPAGCSGEEGEYGLGEAVRPIAAPEGRGRGGAGARGDEAGRSAAAERRRRAALERVEGLREECAGLDAAAAAAQSELRRLLSQRSQLKTSHAAELRAAAAGKAKAAAIRRDLGNAGHLLGPSPRRGGEDAEGSPATTYLESLRLKSEELSGRVRAAAADVQAAVEGMRAGEAASRKKPDAWKQLKEAQKQLSKAAADLEARRAELQRLNRQAQTQANEAPTAHDEADRRAGVTTLKTKHRKLVVTAEKLEEALEALEEEMGKLSEQISSAEACLATRKDRLDTLDAQVEAMQSKVGREAARLQAEMEGVRAELQRLQEQRADVAGGADCDGAPGAARSGRRTRQRRASSATASSESSDGSSDSDFGVRPSRKQAEPQPLKQGVKRRKQASKAASVAEDEAWVAAAGASLARKQAELRRAKEEVNTAALKEDLEAMKALEQVHASLLEKEARAAAATAAIEQLVTLRYTGLSQALATTNAELSKVYQFLTGWLGDAYLQYTADKRMLFVSGVTFNVRPDQHRWRPFASLSGGQQALSTLALSLAMQSAFPSPFYFLDEVDAALDTLHAQRVAEYMLLRSRGEGMVHPSMHTQAPAAAAAVAQDRLEVGGTGVASTQSCPQYIVVSHKPQLSERASCLVGVYSHAASSQAVTVMMEQAEVSQEGQQ